MLFSQRSLLSQLGFNSLLCTNFLYDFARDGYSFCLTSPSEKWEVASPHLPLFVCPSCLGLPAPWGRTCLIVLLNTFKLRRVQSLKLISTPLQGSQGKSSKIPCADISGSLAVSQPAPAFVSTTSLLDPLAHRPSCHKPAVLCHSLCNPYPSCTSLFPKHPLGDPAQTHSI